MEAAGLQQQLADSEGRVAKLRAAVVALRNKSAEVEALCVRQRAELEQARQERQRERQALLQRCQAAEARAQTLEGELAAARQALAARREAQAAEDGRALEPAAAGGGAGPADSAVINSAVSLCEGALASLKAALAAGQGPGAEAASQSARLLPHQLPPRGPLAGQGQGRSPSAAEAAPAAESADPSQAARQCLSQLLQTRADQERVKAVAGRLAALLQAEPVFGAAAVAQSVVRELAECGRSQAGLASPCEPSEADSSRRTQGAALPLSLQEGSAIEAVRFTRVWCGEARRQRAAVTSLLMACLAVHQLHAPLLDSLQQALGCALATWLAGPEAGASTGGCAIAAALALTHRLRGNRQAARTLALDLLLGCHVCGWQAALPLLAAALTAWPDVLSAVKGAPDAVCAEAHRSLQALCEDALEGEAGAADAATRDGSVSCSTSGAELPPLAHHAVLQLQQLGARFWGWPGDREAGRKRKLPGSALAERCATGSGEHLKRLETAAEKQAPLLGAEFELSLVAALQDVV